MRRKKSSSFLFPFVSWLAVLFVLGGFTAVVTAQANSPDRVFIIGSPNAERFPEISVLIRAVDQNNNVVTALVDRHIKLFENEKQIASQSVTPGERTPAYVVFVIDQGEYFSPGNRRQAIQQAMRQWVEEGHFREGFDTVAILSRRVVDGRDQTVEILAPTQSQNTFLNAVNQLTLESTEARTDGLALVDDGLTRLRQLVPQTGAASTAVVYVGSIVESVGGQDRAATDALALASKAREQNSIIHTFDSDASHRFAEPMINLASASGGTYVALRSDRSNDANVRAVYQGVLDQAQTHIVTYRSNFDSALDNPGARNVVIVPSNVPLNAAESVASYSIAPSPPAVRISAPANDFVINREPTHADDGSWSYRVGTVEVEASVDWENNVAPRNLAEAELVINGQTLPAIVPEVVNNRFKLTWDVSGFENVRETVRLQVRIRDELGLETTSTAVQLTVNAQLPEPTPTPAPTAPPAAAGTSPSGSSETTDSQNMLLLGGGVGLFLLVLVVIVGFFLFQRNQTSAPTPSAAQAANKRPLNVEKTMVGGQALGQLALAKVEIEVARKDLVGESVELYSNRTSFGRDPRQCDIQLYDEDEKSSVSGLHCTIQYDAAQRKFFLTDDNSSNGTFINGERLKPNLPRQLTDNTTITLGSIGRRGAKIRFHTVTQTAEQFTAPLASAKRIDPDKTMLDPNSTQLGGDMLGGRTGGTTELGGSPLEQKYPPNDGNETVIDMSPPAPDPWRDEQTMPGLPDDPQNRPNSPKDEDDSWLEEL